MTIAAMSPNSLPQHIVLDGISWELYENLLRELDERHISLTYDNGVLEIMARCKLMKNGGRCSDG